MAPLFFYPATYAPGDGSRNRATSPLLSVHTLPGATSLLTCVICKQPPTWSPCSPSPTPSLSPVIREMLSIDYLTTLLLLLSGRITGMYHYTQLPLLSLDSVCFGTSVSAVASVWITLFPHTCVAPRSLQAFALKVLSSKTPSRSPNSDSPEPLTPLHFIPTTF
jgi:hypothetical protein